MICIIAGNFDEAWTFASGQNLKEEEWFYPLSIEELRQKKDYHVLVIGTAGQNVPSSYFEKLYYTAMEYGRKK